MLLEKRAAIVTGASRGIGRSIALSLAESGADLVINGNNLEALQSLKKEIEGLNRGCIIVRGDVADYELSEEMAQVCKKNYGKIDILVNNAGINSRYPFLELPLEEWKRMMDVNLNGVFYTCRAVLPYMVEQKSGSVINISSTAGKTAHATASISYGASKAAVNSMTQKLAYEMGQYHIRVNGVCPGPILTDMSSQWTEEYKKTVTGKIPLGRLGTTENVADVVVFLASDMADFITGETINVNGGSFMN